MCQISSDSSDAPDTVCKHRALVVDDYEDTARGLELMLKSLGYEVIIAGDGIDALRHATAFKPGLVLIDIGLPKLDGYDTCGVIRSQPWGSQTRLVAVTGKDPEELHQRAGKAGFDTWLLKPVDFDDLRRIALNP